jgi:uncharacterized hydrophobic protein (TIGR00271 family)
VQGRPQLAVRSLVALLAGFPVGIAAAYLASLIFKWTNLTPDEFIEAEHTFGVSFANPDFFTFFVAFCAGIAGVLSLTTQKSGALAGVLISVTTIPAAANIGIEAAYENWPAWRGSMEQLAINLGAICAAGIITLIVQRVIFSRRRAEHRHASRVPRAGGPPLLR